MPNEKKGGESKEAEWELTLQGYDLIELWEVWSVFAKDRCVRVEVGGSKEAGWESKM